MVGSGRIFEQEVPERCGSACVNRFGGTVKLVEWLA